MGKVRVSIWKEDGVLNHPKLRVKNIFTLEYDGGARQFFGSKISLRKAGEPLLGCH